MVGKVVFCDVCGSVRMVSVGDCKLCEVMARNVALEEEVREVRSVLKEAREEVSRLRTENSVRPKIGEVEGTGEPEGESWRVVCKGRRRGTSPPRGGEANPPKFEVACSNRFSLLATSQEQGSNLDVLAAAAERISQEEKEAPLEIQVQAVEGDGSPRAQVVDRTQQQEESKSGAGAAGPEVLLIGDSQVR